MRAHVTLHFKRIWIVYTKWKILSKSETSARTNHLLRSTCNFYVLDPVSSRLISMQIHTACKYGHILRAK